MPSSTLPGAGMERLHHAQRVLLSSLDHDTLEDWQQAANQVVSRVVEADRAVFSFPHGLDLGLVTDRVIPEFPARFKEFLRGAEGGDLLFSDPVIEEAARIRRQGGTGAYHMRNLDPAGRADSSPAVAEVFGPAGLQRMTGLSLPLPVGEVTQFFAFDRPDASGYGEKGMTALTLLVPAWAAGVRMRLQLRQSREAIVQTIDRMPCPLCLYAGRELLHMNPSFLAIIPPQRESHVRGRMDALVRPHAERLQSRSGASLRAPLPAIRHVDLGGRAMLLSVSYLRIALGGAKPTLLVRAEPDRKALRSRLTPRQEEVATLMARGMSDKRIARTLGISVSTVRNHAAAVRRRLEVSSRAEVAFRLAQGGGVGERSAGP